VCSCGSFISRNPDRVRRQNSWEKQNGLASNNLRHYRITAAALANARRERICKGKMSRTRQLGVAIGILLVGFTCTNLTVVTAMFDKPWLSTGHVENIGFQKTLSDSNYIGWFALISYPIMLECHQTKTYLDHSLFSDLERGKILKSNQALESLYIFATGKESMHSGMVIALRYAVDRGNKASGKSISRLKRRTTRSS